MDYINAFKLICFPPSAYKQWNDHYRSSPIREDGLETMAYLSDYRFKSALSLICFGGLMTRRVSCEIKGWMNDKLIYHHVKSLPKHPFLMFLMYSSFVFCFAKCYHYAYRFQTLHKQCELVKYDK